MITLQEYLDAEKRYPFYAKDYEGIDEDKRIITEYNQDLIGKYPWLKPRNRWSGEDINDYDYRFTELDAMPTGWRIAFGEKMCEELQRELFETDSVDTFQIAEIKEKYGGLRFYIGEASEKIHKIIDKYESLSYNICIKCGAPAKWTTCGWISPFCDECKNELEKSGEIHDKFALLKEEE